MLWLHGHQERREEEQARTQEEEGRRAQAERCLEERLHFEAGVLEEEGALEEEAGQPLSPLRRERENGAAASST
jgi:hypothetical protein